MGIISKRKLIGILENSMILLSIGDYFQTVIKGLVLLIDVGIDNKVKNKKL